MPDELVIALRAHVRRADTGPTRRQAKRGTPGWPRSVLVVDTETTIDASQRLIFGSWRYARWQDAHTLVCAAEGLIYADDLARASPEAHRCLSAYASSHQADVAAGHDTTLSLLTRGAFAEKVLWPAIKAGALIVGFNLPFDLSRLATHSGRARGRFRGGFSFRLWDFAEDGGQREHRYRPRVCVKHIDSKRSFIGLTRRAANASNTTHYRGRFLDLRTLGFALTNTSHSLDSACTAFGVEHGKVTATTHGIVTPAYIGYNRRDVLATSELLVKLREEFDQHPIRLDPCQALSPASIGKAYLRTMGVATPDEQFARLRPRLLGRTMSAYYGGRAECRIRRQPIPVVYVDFLSMYPTVNALLGLWAFLTAERLEVEDATQDVRELLDGLSVERGLQPATWRRLTFFAEVMPEDDRLPVRAQYGEGSDAFNIGLNHLTSSRGVWYAGPDVAASTILIGKAPRVLRAFRLVPRGHQASLRSVRLRGQIDVDPRRNDFFTRLIEERQRVKGAAEIPTAERARLDAFVKVLANSTSYGIFAELNREELPAKRRVKIAVFGVGKPYACMTSAPETPGTYCFPPIAALITAGARLMLSLLERCVTDQGGAYVFCDTDSMAIAASRRGGPVACQGGPERLRNGKAAIRALSWAQIEAIVHRFTALNPYDRARVPGSILKVEDENCHRGKQRQLYAYAISAKRYVLYTQVRAGITVVKYSEHGLGHLLNPTNPDDPSREWIQDAWEAIVREALGLPQTRPAWLDRPAVARITISSPVLLQPFTKKSRRSSYAERVKPMNFLLSVLVARLGHPAGVDPQRFHLVAPYSSDGRRWVALPWTDVHSGRQYRVSTSADAAAELVRVKSYRDVLAEYRVHTEPKSAAADGAPCSAQTVGLLARRHVHAVGVLHIGKESNALESVEAGVEHNWADVVLVYPAPPGDDQHTLGRQLSGLPCAQLARDTGLAESTIHRIVSGRSKPRATTFAALSHAAAELRDGRGGASFYTVAPPG